MLKIIEGFDQLNGQEGQQLLASLTSVGFTVTPGLSITEGRKVGSVALELQVLAGRGGDSWSTRSTALAQHLYGADVSATGHCVAVGANGSALYSDNLIDFFPLILGIGFNMRDIAHGNGTWIAVGDTGTILRSTDGMNFASRPMPSGYSGFSMDAVATDGAGNWMAVGGGGPGVNPGMIYTSTDDGVTWAAINFGTGGYSCVAHHGGVWMLGAVSGKLSTSPDMVNFTARTTGTAVNIDAIAVSDTGTWFIGCGAAIRRSVDNGVTWGLVGSDIFGASSAGNVTALAFSDGRWVAGGSTGEIAYSDDENTWATVVAPAGGLPRRQKAVTVHGKYEGFMIVGDKATSPSDATNVIAVSLAPPNELKYTVPMAGDKLTVGWAHVADARGRIMSITDVVDLDWPAYIRMGGVNGVAIPARNVWYYYEVTIDKLANTITLHINNTLDLTCPLPAGAATMTEFEFVWITENGATTKIDDIYAVDDKAPNGETLVSRLGPIQIPLRLPDADQGENDWSTSQGSAHWPMVGLLPPNDTSYIRSATSGAQDLFTSTTALPDGAGTTLPILAVGVVALALKGDIDNRKLGLIVGAPGATQKEIVDDTLNTVPEYSTAIFEKAPGDVAWDNVNTVSTPFGVAVRP